MHSGLEQYRTPLMLILFYTKENTAFFSGLCLYWGPINLILIFQQMMNSWQTETDGQSTNGSLLTLIKLQQSAMTWPLCSVISWSPVHLVSHPWMKVFSVPRPFHILSPVHIHTAAVPLCVACPAYSCYNAYLCCIIANYEKYKANEDEGLFLLCSLSLLL